MVNEDNKNRNDKDDQAKLAEHEVRNWWLNLGDVRTSSDIQIHGSVQNGNKEKKQIA